jgi:deoxyribodipyrimidine photo-lyase
MQKAKKETLRIIHWFKNDLRLHDNYALNWSIEQIKFKSDTYNKTEIVPIYCFDPRIFCLQDSQTKYMTRKTGIARAKFQIESVECLRKNLRKMGSNLMVVVRKPEEVIPELLIQDKNS